MKPAVEIDSPYMTSAEAADYLRYASVAALYKAIPQVGIPVCRRGGKTFLFDKRDLDAWLRGHRATRRRHGRSGRSSAVPLSDRVAIAGDQTRVASSDDPHPDSSRRSHRSSDPVTARQPISSRRSSAGSLPSAGTE